MATQRIPVHVEVSLLPTCAADDEVIREEVNILLREQGNYVYSDGPLDFSSNKLLSQCIDSVSIVDTNESTEATGVSFWQGDPQIHIYHLSQDGPEAEMIDGAGEEEEIAACDQWILPSARLQGVWESLILEDGVKNRLLEYATSAMLFTDKGVSKNIISWNRVVLLHGPPGTGKTSLCKALAHKLSIRLVRRYSSGQLLEINAHSLFSKWFSESGKLVQRLFEHILELAEDEECLVCVLIDEVESLTAARSAALGGNEPSDAVRVVNAVLTQIDNLRERDNVLILTTSNVSEAIDLAFVDRADIKQYIGLPPAAACYRVLHSCLEELVRVGIISPALYLPQSLDKALELAGAVPRAQEVAVLAGGRLEKGGSSQPDTDGRQDGSVITHRDRDSEAGVIEGQNPMTLGLAGGQKGGIQKMARDMAHIATAAEGLSGRALRKLPFQAHAFFVQRQTCTLERFLWALEQAVHKERVSREELDLVGTGPSENKTSKP